MIQFALPFYRHPKKNVASKFGSSRDMFVKGFLDTYLGVSYEYLVKENKKRRYFLDMYQEISYEYQCRIPVRHEYIRIFWSIAS